MEKKISDFMTPCLYNVAAEASFEEALQQMELRRLRHMPVAKEGELIGVLTQQDALLCRALCAATAFRPSVGEVCQKDPFIVATDTLVSQVAYEMAERRLDYVLVADEKEQVVGIFTTIDACRYIHYLTSEK